MTINFQIKDVSIPNIAEFKLSPISLKKVNDTSKCMQLNRTYKCYFKKPQNESKYTMCNLSGDQFNYTFTDLYPGCLVKVDYKLIAQPENDILLESNTASLTSRTSTFFSISITV